MINCFNQSGLKKIINFAIGTKNTMNHQLMHLYLCFNLYLRAQGYHDSPYKSLKRENRVSTFSKALNVVIIEYYLKNYMDFDVLILDESCEHFAFDVMANIWKSNPKLKISRIWAPYKIYKNKTFFVSQSAIIFIENFDVVKNYELDQRVRLSENQFEKLLFFVICIESITEINEIHRNSLRKFQVYNSETNNQFLYFFNITLRTNVIIQNSSNNNLEMFTFDFFVKPRCSHKLKRINKFVIDQQKWTTSNFGKDELKQFNGCHLKIITGTPLPRSPYERETSCIPYFEFLMNIFAKKFEFDYSFHQARQIPDFHVLMNFGGSLSDYSTSRQNGATYEFYRIYEIFFTLILTTGEPYTSFEKLLLPLDTETWILTILFFICGFIVIIIVKSRSEIVRNFVFGANVYNPMFNMMIAFFGQGQMTLPGRNFSRYILIIFILFSLIIRTGYQGLQFELMLKVNVICTFQHILMQQSFMFFSEFLNYLFIYIRMSERSRPIV